MPTFVHISDIHFGQERKDTGQVVQNNDIKNRLIADARAELRRLGKHPAEGILVTGDIAFSGKTEEYAKAGKWLDDLASAIGCTKTAVHLVPGNHDIDRDEISPAVSDMISKIGDRGEAALKGYLSHETDRGILYKKFAAYIPFALGYNCPLDTAGGRAGDKPVTLADGRTLRFIGLNTAIACSRGEDEGRLILGQAQRVLPFPNAGEELIILAHHPMRWLQDGEDALNYVRARARMLITGHEHNLSVTPQYNSKGHCFLELAAGATVPPSNEVLHYTYNIIDFELDAATDELLVSVHPRSWHHKEKEFEDDASSLKGQDRLFRLGCPFFRGEQPIQAAASADESKARGDDDSGSGSVPVDEREAVMPTLPPAEAISEDFALVLLRFFRDLSPAQRMRVLVRLGALPDDWEDDLSHGLEREAIDDLEEGNRLSALNDAIDEVLGEDRKTAKEGGR